MEGVRVFYHLYPTNDKEYLAVYSAIVEVNDKQVENSIPAPAVFKTLNPIKFFKDFVVPFEKYLLSTSYPVKHYFVNDKWLSYFCVEGIKRLPAYSEIFRIISVSGIPLLPGSETLEKDGLFTHNELLESAVSLFGDLELAGEVALVFD